MVGCCYVKYVCQVERVKDKQILQVIIKIGIFAQKFRIKICLNSQKLSESLFGLVIRCIICYIVIRFKTKERKGTYQSSERFVRAIIMKCILDRVMQEKIIAIIRGVKKEQIQSTVLAIKKGGINCLEVTLDHSSTDSAYETYEMIALLRKEYGDSLCIGAGTVLSVEEVVCCADAGAGYIISPNINDDVIKKTKEMGLISIPGALTPSEIVQAHEAGADIVKIFPAGILGVEYIKAVRSPLKHIAMSAVGNITPENCRDFLKEGCSCIGVGGKLVNCEAIRNGDFDVITDCAREYVKAVKIVNT